MTACSLVYAAEGSGHFCDAGFRICGPRRSSSPLKSALAILVCCHQEAVEAESRGGGQILQFEACTGVSLFLSRVNPRGPGEEPGAGEGTGCGHSGRHRTLRVTSRQRGLRPNPGHSKLLRSLRTQRESHPSRREEAVKSTSWTRSRRHSKRDSESRAETAQAPGRGASH